LPLHHSVLRLLAVHAELLTLEGAGLRLPQLTAAELLTLDAHLHPLLLARHGECPSLHARTAAATAATGERLEARTAASATTAAEGLEARASGASTTAAEGLATAAALLLRLRRTAAAALALAATRLGHGRRCNRQSGDARSEE
jgi:hypothetical protein